MKEVERPVHLKLTADEALVLFEWLSRTDEGDALAPLMEHESEQRVLWRLLAQLEKTLAEPFDPGYAGMLNAARERVSADLEMADRHRTK